MALDDAAVEEFDENIAAGVGIAPQRLKAPFESVEILDGGGGPVDGRLNRLAGADGGRKVPQANGLVVDGGDAFAAVDDEYSVGRRFQSGADDGGLTAHGTAQNGDPGQIGEGEEREKSQGGEGAPKRPPGGGAEDLNVGREAEKKAERSGISGLLRLGAADAGDTQEAAIGGEGGRFAGHPQLGAEGGAAGGERKTLFVSEKGTGGENAVDGDERAVAAMGQSGSGGDGVRHGRGPGPAGALRCPRERHESRETWGIPKLRRARRAGTPASAPELERIDCPYHRRNTRPRRSHPPSRHRTNARDGRSCPGD